MKGITGAGGIHGVNPKGFGVAQLIRGRGGNPLAAAFTARNHCGARAQRKRVLQARQ